MLILKLKYQKLNKSGDKHAGCLVVVKEGIIEKQSNYTENK